MTEDKTQTHGKNRQGNHDTTGPSRPATVSSASSLELDSGTISDDAIWASTTGGQTTTNSAPQQYSFSTTGSTLPPVANPLAGTIGGANAIAPSPPLLATAAPAPAVSVVSHIPTITYSAPTSSRSSGTMKPLPTPVPIMPCIPSSSLPQAPPPAPVQPNNNTVAEFLYQLTKMLTDDNKSVIEWSNGKIEVHNPTLLASDVLHKYFRHSKFASFQRQLNYFGFRKLAGKGKMAPCSYVNEATTDDLRSILLIKRKTSATTGTGKGGKKRDRAGAATTQQASATAPVNPVLAGILQKTATTASSSNKRAQPVTSAKLAIGKGVKHQLNGFLKGNTAEKGSSQAALAKSAVGRGVRHGYSIPPVSGAPVAPATAAVAAGSASPQFTFKDPHQLGMDIQTSLSELSNNFKNSLKDAEQSTGEPYVGMLKRDDSLVDLAMIPPVEMELLAPQPIQSIANSVAETPATSMDMMPFVDFPHEDLFPPPPSDPHSTQHEQNQVGS
eukprot:CAMPEP_0194027366 /NCGR_PEP_ID=MMETSP0009_2-20130614/1523_1 /TAXON_ID=210454 /ORGANISM="Grammatophora oceanica, Strain CCMP 410" /LENGTH=498 /DNA_ID=CAMNT_0038666411 /DNA_START=307 /DNA_END=1803 /DNA_ORIENTATION=+